MSWPMAANQLLRNSRDRVHLLVLDAPDAASSTEVPEVVHALAYSSKVAVSLP